MTMLDELLASAAIDDALCEAAHIKPRQKWKRRSARARADLVRVERVKEASVTYVALPSQAAFTSARSRFVKLYVLEEDVL